MRLGSLPWRCDIVNCWRIAILKVRLTNQASGFQTSKVSRAKPPLKALQNSSTSLTQLHTSLDRSLERLCIRKVDTELDLEAETTNIELGLNLTPPKSEETMKRIQLLLVEEKWESSREELLDYLVQLATE